MNYRLILSQGTPRMIVLPQISVFKKVANCCIGKAHLNDHFTEIVTKYRAKHVAVRSVIFKTRKLLESTVLHIPHIYQYLKEFSS